MPKPVTRSRNTKIVSTLGPASNTYEQIKALFLAGADVFRLNFSHGIAADHAGRMAIIRRIEKEFNHPIAVLGDLQGPKLRVGVFENGPVMLKKGQKFRLDLDKTPGNAARVCLPHPAIFKALKKDSELLLDDGKLRLRVTARSDKHAETVVVVGGKLSERKGVNVPSVILPLSALTAKDRKDLQTALEIGCDWIALSFVQRPEDLREARKLIKGRAALLAKLEKPSAIEFLEEIIQEADGVMVARGDLGVEMPAEDVPVLQRRILREARKAGKPVIVATQMLESMISAPTATRAEVSDVATAVYEGTDAVMLSAESANGDYPVEAVSTMNRVATRIEQDPLYQANMKAQHPEHTASLADAITSAARQVAETVKTAAIVTYTTSGDTTLRMSRERPNVKVISLTPNDKTARRLVLSFGTHPVVSKDIANFNEMAVRANKIVREQGLAKQGDTLVITAGVPFGQSGNTNTLRVVWVKNSDDPRKLSMP